MAIGRTGRPKAFLRDAIRRRKLKAKVIGKGWRVKSDDLERLVDAL
jgi:hypothetical protein